MSESRRLAPKWLSVVIGLCFLAVPGLVLVITSVPKFDKFASRTWMEIYDYPAQRGSFGSWRIVRLSDSQHGVITDASGPVDGALFGMALFALGTGIATARFLSVTGGRNLSRLLALLWHGLGITTGVWFLMVAPRPLLFSPLLAIGVFEWLGLFPLALGISKKWFQGRPNSAAWNAWLGAMPGAVVGGIVGVVIDYVRFGGVSFGITGSDPMYHYPTFGWILGILAGGCLTGIGFVIWGWWQVSPWKYEGPQHFLNQ